LSRTKQLRIPQRQDETLAPFQFSLPKFLQIPKSTLPRGHFSFPPTPASSCPLRRLEAYPGESGGPSRRLRRAVGLDLAAAGRWGSALADPAAPRLLLHFRAVKWPWRPPRLSRRRGRRGGRRGRGCSERRWPSVTSSPTLGSSASALSTRSLSLFLSDALSFF
jgi:hypothetical protein